MPAKPQSPITATFGDKRRNAPNSVTSPESESESDLTDTEIEAISKHSGEVDVFMTNEVNRNAAPPSVFLNSSGAKEKKEKNTSRQRLLAKDDIEEEEEKPLLQPRRASMLNNLAHLTQPAELKKAAETAWTNLAQSLIATHNKMRQSTWLLSVTTMVASLGVIWSGLFDIISVLLRLRPVLVVVKMYQVFFALCCLAVEASRYVSVLGIRSFIHRWMPFLELSIGRGFIQLLAAGLAMVDQFFSVHTIPAVVLAACGVFNIFWGIKCALKIRKLFKLLNNEPAATKAADLEEGPIGVLGAGANGGLPSVSTLLMMQQKFSVLDINHDGKLSREELAAGCESLNLPLIPGDVDMIFEMLDPKRKGYVDVVDFENWWLIQKSPVSF